MRLADTNPSRLLLRQYLTRRRDTERKAKASRKVVAPSGGNNPQGGVRAN
jgi:hypothetical protein